MNFYQRLGYLALGSRLRRLSEAFISEVIRAYQQQGIEFEAAWFPVFYLLADKKELSIKELSDQLEVTHPAASQLISALRKKGLVTVKTSKKDGRKQLVQLSADGLVLLDRVKPVWNAILQAMDKMTATQEDTRHLLDALSALEYAFQEHVLSDLITEEAKLPEYE
ncbi:MAG: helix-turn-helix domain-containing protein [Mucilaginibacter sp.]